MSAKQPTEVIALVEGETEFEFVQHLITPILQSGNLYMRPVLFGKRGGGIPRWSSGQKDVLNYLKRAKLVTTLVDFYGLPHDWPGRSEAAKLDWKKRGQFVENALSDWAQQNCPQNSRAESFIPCIQVHEFESLLYADPSTTALFLAISASHSSDCSIKAKLEKILESAGGYPEAINDSYETAPSRQLKGIVPAYEKRAWGYQIANEIGIPKLRESCKWLDNWLTRLEALETER